MWFSTLEYEHWRDWPRVEAGVCRGLWRSIQRRQSTQKPRLLVVNTDPASQPGRHWVCMSVKDGYGEYFDSFGQPPTANFECYLNRHCSSWTFNERQLQSVISRFCGHYCIYYCMLSSRGIDMPKIVSSFTTDTALNDVLVHGFVCRA